MAASPPQTLAPAASSRAGRLGNVYYPQARVTLSVMFETFGEPGAAKVFPVQPRAISLYSNSFKEADTWTVDFDANDFPFSPDLVRGGAAEIYLFKTPGVGQRPDVVRASDDPTTALIEGLEPSMVGLFDDHSLEMSSDGRTVTISGTDYTALFTSKQWDPAKSGRNGRIPSGKPLDKVLQELKDQVPSAPVMTIEVRPEGVRMPIVGAAEGRTNKKGIPVAGGSYWDVMYDLAVRYGFVLYVQGLKIVLVELEAFAQSRQAAVRKMAWGRNLTMLRLSRRLGKEQVPIIECRSYDEKLRKIVTARFPATAAQVAQTRVTGLGAKNDEVKIITVPNVRSKKQLEDVARQIYYTLARSEQKVEIATNDLSDLEGNDIIELRTGDAMTIGFDSFNADSVILEGMNEGQRVQTLKRLGYDPEVAKAIAQAFDKTNLFRVPFRVREATLEWNADGGLNISAELQNFVNARKQVA